ncbi:MAG: hypothetical protein RLZ75_739 [Pseudomonadota bacterium]|jgi:hypothetical protein
MSAVIIGAILPVGTIIHSMLTIAQFSSQYGDNWVIADGRLVTGSLFESITGISQIPDLRGGFLRAKGATLNPDGDLALGTLTAPKYASHYHQEQSCSYGSTGVATPAYLLNTSSGGVDYSIFATPGGGIERVATSGPLNTVASGGNETAPVSITVNVFIRIN